MFVYVFGNNKVTFPCFSSYCLFACLTNISEVRKIVPFSTLPQALSLSVFLMPLFLLRHQSQFTRVDRVTYTLEIHFLIVLEAGHPRSRFQLIGFLVWTIFLACKWPPSCSVLTRSFLAASAQREREGGKEKEREGEGTLCLLIRTQTIRSGPHL